MLTSPPEIAKIFSGVMRGTSFTIPVTMGVLLTNVASAGISYL